jgi:hypothetical protein
MIDSPVLNRMTWVGLLLADFVLDGNVPELEGHCRTAPPAARDAAATFFPRFGSTDGECMSIRRAIRDLYASCGSLVAVARLVLTKIIVPQDADWGSVRIPSRSLFFLYYPWRIARLGWKNLPGTAR